jgi:hypothetical protein
MARTGEIALGGAPVGGPVALGKPEMNSVISDLFKEFK